MERIRRSQAREARPARRCERRRAAGVRVSHRLLYPLHLLPPLDPAAPDAEKLVERMKLEEHNAKNAATRQRITFAKWTEIAAACKLCTEKTALLLSRLIFETCHLRKRGVEGGFFDGAQAYGILLKKLPEEKSRTKQDKQFYKDA